MSVRIFLVAIVTTLVSAIPLYFLASNSFQISLSNLPFALLAVFLFALFVAAMSAPGPSTGNQTERELGQVKWFNANKGFGFITRDNGEDIFVHFRSIRGKGRRILKDGQRVEFAVTESNKGLQAEDVAAAS